eukprot:10760814-Alexandrium_andersonii.AAC.1
MHPSGASGATFEAVSGPAQFKLRTPQPISHFSLDRRAPDGSAEFRGVLGSSGTPGGLGLA